MFGLASDSGTTAGAGPRPTGVRAWRGKGTYQTPGRRVGVAFGVGTHSQSDAVTTQREKDREWMATVRDTDRPGPCLVCVPHDF